jgi:hypothetical protein
MTLVDEHEQGTMAGQHIVVVTTMPLSAQVRAELSSMLGDGYIVVDVKAAPSTTNIVLTTVVTGRTLRSLRALFPQARILLTEFNDDGRDISYPGPITRALDAGPDGYYVAHGLEALPAIVESEAQLQLSGSTRPSPPMIDVGERGPVEPPGSIWPPVASQYGTIIWMLAEDSAATPPDGVVLGLEHIDHAVTRLVETNEPRETGLWRALVAESAVYLARAKGDDVLVDVSGLSPAALAQIRIHVASERVTQAIWPLDATARD